MREISAIAFLVRCLFATLECPRKLNLFLAWANIFCLESRGFAFVRYYDKRDAEDAIDRLNGYELDGR